MVSLFSFSAVYTGADGKPVTEEITTLPWQRAVTVEKPFTGEMNVAFSRRPTYPDKQLYNIGFSSYITVAASDGKSGSQAVSSMNRAGDDNVLRLRLQVPDGVDPGQVQMSAAPLRYDKHFAFTLTVDDSNAGAYSRIWSLIHGRWIDDKKFWHLGAVRTTGYTPDHRLVVTDGCGNDRPFGFSCAIWPTWGNNWNPLFVVDAVPPTSGSPYLTWEELRLLSDYGVGLCYHNVDERIFGKIDPVKIAEGLEADYLRTYEKTGFSMKTLAIPDGNQSYAEAAKHTDRVSIVRNVQYGKGHEVCLNTCGDLYKASVTSGVGSPTVAQKLAELAEEDAAENPHWVLYTVHTPSVECMDMLETIYRLYGKPGKDNIWAASWDEIYEYVALREHAQITRTVDGRTVTFEVTLPRLDEYAFPALTFRVTGVGAGCTVEAASDNITSLSVSPKDGGMLVNTEFGAKLLRLAEKYTLAYEKHPSLAALADAQGFVSRLLPELAEPFERRLSSVVEPGVNQVTRAAVPDYQTRYDGYTVKTTKKL